MPYAEAKRQKLNTRLSVLVLRDRSKRFLLGLDEREEAGFSLVIQPRPGESYAESCQAALAKKYGQIDARLELRHILPPCEQNALSFTGICEQTLSSALLKSVAQALGPGIVADTEEIKALIEKDYFISPLFRLVFESGLINS